MEILTQVYFRSWIRRLKIFNIKMENFIEEISITTQFTIYLSI